MSELATVVCVYKTGGRDFGIDYVKHLYESCVKNGAEHFICLSDDPKVGNVCDHVPLTDNLPGWWSKLELFKLDPARKYVYFDLDTIIHKPIIDLLAFDHKFTTLKDFNKKVKRLASGIMAWSGDYSYLSKTFDRSMIPAYTPLLGGKLGDQAYIEDMIKVEVQYVQDLFPGLVSSYKWDDPYTKLNSSIVCYHGKPRPRETGWKI